jgi:hypothetical protein
MEAMLPSNNSTPAGRFPMRTALVHKSRKN